MTADEQGAPDIEAIATAYAEHDHKRLLREMGDALIGDDATALLAAVMIAAADAWPEGGEPDRDDPAGVLLWTVAEFTREWAGGALQRVEEAGS